MPTVAIISDIHANLPALEAVIHEIDKLGVVNILCCGDVVGYGPHPRECVRLLRKRNIPSVLGNHDHYTLQVRDNATVRSAEKELRLNSVWAGILHAVDQLEDDDFEWLDDLPTFIRFPQAIMGHSAMHDIENWPYLVDDADILATLDELKINGVPLGFFGHSHDQEWFTTSPEGQVNRHPQLNSILPAEGTAAVVVGSVGQPRTGDPRAAWTLWNPDEKTIEFRRTPYPIEDTIAAILTCGLPLESAERLLFGE